jgi:hypothetical protein
VGAVPCRCTDLQGDVDDLRDQLSVRFKLVEKLDGQLSAAKQQLTHKHRLMAEVSHNDIPRPAGSRLPHVFNTALTAAYLS